MTKEFVPYELAQKLKALGFNEPCFGFYLEDGTWTPASYSREGTMFPSNSDLLPEWCAAPLFQQAFRWFREKYGDLLRYDWGEVPHFLMIQIEMTKGKTYEEAELACLTKLITIE